MESEVIRMLVRQYNAISPFIGWILFIVLAFYTLRFYGEASGEKPGYYTYILESLWGDRQPVNAWHLFVVGFWVGALAVIFVR